MGKENQQYSAENVRARLRGARRDKGLTQEEAAKALGMSRTTMVAIEKGDRAITPEELAAAAELYGRPVNELLRPGPPVEDFVGQFRASLSRTPEAEAFELALRQVERLVDDYCELERLTSAPRPSYPAAYSVGRLDPEAAGSDVASSERNRMGLGDGPIPNLREILEVKLGIRVFFLPLPSEIGGFLAFTEEVGACMAINSDHPADRQQWSMAHELAHFLTRQGEAEVSVSRRYLRIPANERFAESFARDFLMPPNGLRRDFNQLSHKSPNGPTPAGLLELASFYRVSFQAFLLALEGHRLLPRGTYDHLEHEGFRVGEAREILGVLAPKPDTRLLPLRFMALAIDAYRSGQISEGSFARFMRLDRVAARRAANALEPAAEQVPA